MEVTSPITLKFSKFLIMVLFAFEVRETLSSFFVPSRVTVTIVNNIQAPTATEMTLHIANPKKTILEITQSCGEQVTCFPSNQALIHLELRYSIAVSYGLKIPVVIILTFGTKTMTNAQIVYGK